MVRTEDLIQTGIVSGIFFAILLGLGFVRQEYLTGTVTDPVLVVVALVPVVVFLAVTGRLRRFSGGGFEIVLQEQGRKLVSPDAAEELDVDPERLSPKRRTAELEQMRRGSPTALTFELGREGFYHLDAIRDYLKSIETLRYVVFTDEEGRFGGYSTVDEFRQLVENDEVDVVDEIENRAIIDRDVVRTEPIQTDCTNEECLHAMDDHDVDEFPVVDSAGKFVGVVTQDAIVRRVVSSLLAEA